MTEITRSFITQVKLDAASTAVVEHGAGVVPNAVFVQPGGPGQLASILPSSYTDTTFKVKLNWHDGRLFASGTVITLAVIVTYEVAGEPPVEPEEPPVFTTSDPKGVWIDPANSNLRVPNEVWNTAEAGPQELRVWSHSHWEVESTQPKEGARTGSIKSYPCSQVLFPNIALSAISMMISKWWHSAPAKGEWNATFDIWFENWSVELMLWVDHRYPGALPPSNATESTTAVIDGVTYTAWRHPNSKPGGWYIALVRQDMRDAGTVDLVKVFNWLRGWGWLKPTYKLGAVDYGIEIADTLKAPEVFEMNDFQLQWTVTA